MEITEKTMIIHHGAASILAVSIEKRERERERLARRGREEVYSGKRNERGKKRMKKRRSRSRQGTSAKKKARKRRD